MTRFLAPEAGGWDKAAELPYTEAFAWATEKLMRAKHENYKTQMLIWSSHLGLYAMGGKPPEPPTME